MASTSAGADHEGERGHRRSTTAHAIALVTTMATPAMMSAAIMAMPEQRYG